MNRLICLILGIVCLTSTGCTFIEPGYVGIKVNSWGDQKGVEDFPLQTGRITYNPFTESVYEFPTFMKNRSWLIQDGEGFTFSTKEGAKISASVGLNYSLEAAKVPGLFVKHRSDLDTITDTYVRQQVQDAFTKAAGKFSNIDIMGTRQQELLDIVELSVSDRLSSRGFIIDNVSFVGAPEPDQRVADSIAQVLQAVQKAQEAEAKVAQVKAEADQVREAAQGKADAILTIAKAQAEANVLVAKSLSPQLLQNKLYEKWDGVAPKVLGESSGGTLLNVGIDSK